jgi:cell wall-associated NlpC family hydrolase
VIKTAALAVAAIFASIVLIAAATGGAALSVLTGSNGGGGSDPSTAAVAQIPSNYLLLYMQASATCAGLDWTILAGIGEVESDHGRSTLPGVSSGANAAGAEGPMQFEPATFAHYDAPVPPGGASPASIYDPADAIYAAARMLCTDGARNGTDLYAAIYAYNHSASYVASVLAAAQTYASSAIGTQPASGATAPGARWTAAIGQEIATRAERWLGWPYSYAAGNAAGPTYGHAVDYDSRNDAHVDGFDCSGLSLYAVAPWRTLAHSAATQYTEAGSLHPSVAQLLPGDLVFWSSNGTVAGIGHDAIYIGNGQVVQAPYSGAFLEVTALDQVESGFLGATRPLT